MSCPFYSFKNSDYYCMKKSDYVNSDCYYRYCRNYSYDECPIYKGSSSGGGCYITTACVSSLGCADDGRELTLLRNFRDTFLKKQSTGEKDIKEYYLYAPQIVSEIDKDKDKDSVYKEIYSMYIEPCIKLIEQNKLKETYNLYKKMFCELKEKYLKN